MREYIIIILILVSLCKVFACSDNNAHPYSVEQITQYEITDSRIKKQIENFLTTNESTAHTFELNFEYYTQEIVIMMYPHILLPKEMIYGVVVINDVNILLIDEALIQLPILKKVGIKVDIAVCHPTNIYSVEELPLYCQSYDVDEPIKSEAFQFSIEK